MKRVTSFSKFLLIFFITVTLLFSIQFILTEDSPSINSINQNLDLNVNQANEILDGGHRLSILEAFDYESVIVRRA